MPRQEQQQHPSNGGRQGLLPILLFPLKCLMAILLIPVVIVVCLIYVFFLLGPLVYYRGTILNSSALTNKYATEGIRLKGRVVKRWKTGEGSDSGPTYHVNVAYRVVDEQQQERYVWHLVVSQEMYDDATLDLIRLPDYARSAILYSSVQRVDPAFPPSRMGALLFAFVWTGLWNLIPVVLTLTNIGSCAFCTTLIGPIFAAMIILELVVGYFVARRDRDSNLRSTLYGAKQIIGDNDEAFVPPHVCYREFFNEERHSFLFVIRCIVRDLCIILAWILMFIYFVVFGGGYVFMSSLVVARWKQKLLESYDESTAGNNVSSVMGSVVCRQDTNSAIVQYQVEAQLYKKRLPAPYRLVPNSRGCGTQMQRDGIPDNPELLYLTNLATSASLKSRIDNRQEETKWIKKQIWFGLVCTTIQVAATTFFAAMAIESNTASSDYKPYLLVAGICVACQVIFGFVSAVFQYHFFFRRDLLYGAKEVVQGETTRRDNDHVGNDDDEEIDLVGAFDDIDGETEGGTETTLSTADESADTFVNNFMKGKFPRLDKAFE